MYIYKNDDSTFSFARKKILLHKYPIYYTTYHDINHIMLERESSNDFRHSIKKNRKFHTAECTRIMLERESSLYFISIPYKESLYVYIKEKTFSWNEFL